MRKSMKDIDKLSDMRFGDNFGMQIHNIDSSRLNIKNYKGVR